MLCTKCQNEKTLDEMSKDKGRRGGISSWCKECRKDNARNWSSKYPEKAEKGRLLKLAQYQASPTSYDKSRSQVLKTRYGIDQSGYMQLLESQEYKCAICGRDSREMTYLLHVDHCHTTGVIRGLLCSPCNVYLGYSKDTPEVYLAAIKYIEKTKEEKKLNVI